MLPRPQGVVRQADQAVFDNAEVSRHFAIIPRCGPEALSEIEAKLYDLVVKRFIAVF